MTVIRRKPAPGTISERGVKLAAYWLHRRAKELEEEGEQLAARLTLLCNGMDLEMEAGTIRGVRRPLFPVRLHAKLSRTYARRMRELFDARQLLHGMERDS